jgi:D-arginine dehydrogenase
VGPHQLISTLPVDRPQDFGSLHRHRSVEPMPDTIAVAGHSRHDELVITNRQRAGIVGLATPTRVEHRSVEQDPVVINIGPDHGGGHVLCVRVGRVDRFCHLFIVALLIRRHTTRGRGTVLAMKVDVAIIGGGIAGLSAGAWLAPRCDVVILETEPTLGYHATGRSAAAYTECYGAETIRRLAQASHEYLTTTADVTSPLPVMFVADSGDPGSIADLLDRFLPLVPSLERLSPGEVVDRCPVFDPAAIAGGVLEPGALNIDVHALQSRYERTIRSSGQSIITSAPVTKIARNARGRWSIDAGDVHIDARVVVNAAGAWADQVAVLAGIAPIGLTPLLRSVFTFNAETESASWPLVVDAREQWYFKPEGPNVLGSGASELPSDPVDARPPEIDVALGIEKINSATTLAIRSVRNTWAGLRTFAPDRIPVVGFDHTTPGFFWLAGQGGYGIKTSPALGELAASLILTDAVPDAIPAFGISRESLSPERLRR